MNSQYAAWRREDSGDVRAALTFLTADRSKKPMCSEWLHRDRTGPMGESHRKAGEKEFPMNWIQRENRLPKERVSFLSWTEANREKQKNSTSEQL